MIHTPPTYLGTLEVTYEHTSLDTYINEIKYINEKLAYCRRKEISTVRYFHNNLYVFVISDVVLDTIMPAFDELFMDFPLLFCIIE